jgi:hypothetical protein
MISYNKKDFNLTKIETINGAFNNAETKNAYHIYGLMQGGGNQPVLIEQNKKGLPVKADFDKLALWLSKNGLKVDMGGPVKGISIAVGIRRDVRMRPKFAAALVRTIVAHFEGVVKLDETFQLPKIKLKTPRRPRKSATPAVDTKGAPVFVSTGVTPPNPTGLQGVAIVAAAPAVAVPPVATIRSTTLTS